MGDRSSCQGIFVRISELTVLQYCSRLQVRKVLVSDIASLLTVLNNIDNRHLNHPHMDVAL